MMTLQISSTTSNIALLILREINNIKNFFAEQATRCLIIKHSVFFSRNFAKSYFYDAMKFRNTGLLIVRSQTDLIYFRG